MSYPCPGQIGFDGVSLFGLGPSYFLQAVAVVPDLVNVLNLVICIHFDKVDVVAVGCLTRGLVRSMATRLGVGRMVCAEKDGGMRRLIPNLEAHIKGSAWASCTQSYAPLGIGFHRLKAVKGRRLEIKHRFGDIVLTGGKALALITGNLSNIGVLQSFVHGFISPTGRPYFYEAKRICNIAVMCFSSLGGGGGGGGIKYK